jgi:pimeloyl-ACP methyl ester carboxylesterase
MAQRLSGMTILAALLTAACQSSPSHDAAIERVGFTFIGGQNIERPATGILGDTADQIRAYQIAVLSLLPAVRVPKIPVVMLPGFGIAADTYLETPDGRPGWAMDFVRAGHPVYVVEPSHTTRSGIDTGFYLKPGTEGKAHQLFSWGATQVWTRWGLGPEYGVPFANSRFPVQSYDKVVSAFTAAEVDRIAGERNITYQLASNSAAITELLERIGPVVLLAHSASGVAAFEVALARPDLVHAVIAVEPVGCPTAKADTLRKVAILSIFGDHMEVRPQMPPRRDECRQAVAAAAARGAVAALYDLPAMGVTGNSHLMMFEDNSADLAAMMLDWLHNKVVAP